MVKRSYCMAITWDPSFETGIEILDTQHKEIMNQACDLACCISLEGNPEMIRKFVARLLETTAAHYATEEFLMKDCGYPDTAAHMAEHAKSYSELCTFADKADAGHPTLGAFVYTFFQGWLKHHMSTQDMEFAKFLGTRPHA